MACGHKEAAAHPPAKAQVRASLREADAANQEPFWVVDDDPVELLTSHPPPAPEIAVDIASDAVRRARTGIDENPSVLDGPSLDDVVDKNEPVRSCPRLDQVELCLVGREANSVRPLEVGRYRRERARFAVEAVDILRQLRFCA